MQSTAEILHSKLVTANASIAVAERRAQAATAEATRVSASASVALDASHRAVCDARAAQRRAEEDLEAALRPDPQGLARVRALEEVAYNARKARDWCEPSHPDREAFAEEAEFHTAVARQARHCLEQGTVPKAVHAHVFADPTFATSVEGLGVCALQDALERIVGERDATTAVTIGQSAAVAAEQQRCDQFLSAVCSDIKRGMDDAAAAYEAAKAAGPGAPRV
jgi:hypothetical protein